MSSVSSPFLRRPDNGDSPRLQAGPVSFGNSPLCVSASAGRRLPSARPHGHVPGRLRVAAPGCRGVAAPGCRERAPGPRAGPLRQTLRHSRSAGVSNRETAGPGLRLCMTCHSRAQPAPAATPESSPRGGISFEFIGPVITVGGCVNECGPLPLPVAAAYDVDLAILTTAGAEYVPHPGTWGVAV